MNGARIFLRLTREIIGEPTFWDAAAIVGVEPVGTATRIQFADGSYVRVTEAADAVLLMMQATIVSAALLGPVED